MEENEKNEEQKVEIQNQEQEVTQQNNSEKEMKENKNKEKKVKKGSYIRGTIGAILGGVVFAIIWAVIYLFANHMVIPILGTFIPIGAYLGYLIFRGKIKRPLRKIITIISLLFIILLTTVICPAILMIEAGYEITLNNLMGLYSETREEIRNVIIQDLIAGLAFTVIGIIMTILFLINPKIKSMINEDEIKQLEEEAKSRLKEKSETLKKVCVTLNCMTTEKAIAKKAILKELKNTYNLKNKKAKLYFATCKLAKILRKHKGKYYYDENDEENKIEQAIKINKKLKTRKKVRILFELIILVVIIAAGVFGYFFFKEEPYYVPETNIELEIDEETQDFYGTQEEISEAFGSEAANFYEFIVLDKEKQYDIYGQVIPKTLYGDQEFGTIIQEERDYYAPYLGEDITSQIEDKQLGDDLLKSYNYTSEGADGKTYRCIIYLYQNENHYLWINVYTYADYEITKIDTIIDNLIK